MEGSAVHMYAECFMAYRDHAWSIFINNTTYIVALADQRQQPET